MLLITVHSITFLNIVPNVFPKRFKAIGIFLNHWSKYLNDINIFNIIYMQFMICDML